MNEVAKKGYIELYREIVDSVYEVEVNQVHICTGVAKHCTMCPIVLAVSEKMVGIGLLGLSDGVRMDYGELSWSVSGDSLKLSDGVTLAVVQFDNGKGMKPCTLIMDFPKRELRMKEEVV